MKEKRKRAGRILRRSAGILAAGVTLAVTAGLRIEKQEPETGTAGYGSGKRDDEEFLIAVFGMDRDSGEDDGMMERSDAVKIVSFREGIRIASVQRDLLVWIPEPAEDFGKLNHAYWQGGPDLAVRTLEMNFDLDIRNYAAFSFRAVEVLAEETGGIDVYLDEEEAAILTGKDGGGPGIFHLDRDGVLAYCRLRSAGSDFARMGRQDKVMKALLEKLKQMPFSRILEITGKVMPYVSSGLGRAETVILLRRVLSASDTGVRCARFPANGMDDIAESISYGGYSPLYRLKDRRQMICGLHAFLYGKEACTVSEEAERIGEKITAAFAQK